MRGTELVSVIETVREKLSSAESSFQMEGPGMHLGADGAKNSSLVRRRR